MKRIVVLDTWPTDTNLGNKIITEAALQELRHMFPHDFFYQVPALEYVRAGRKVVRNADHVFLAGTNLLSSNLRKNRDWRFRIADMLWLTDVVLLGVGWKEYEASSPNSHTRFLLYQTLKRTCYHSVRDSYTLKRLSALGYHVLNTGCPTLWMLTKAHCNEIRQDKANCAVLTLTEYNKQPKEDLLLYTIVKKNYGRVYLWPQMYGDYHYGKKLCGNGVVFVDPSIEAFDDLLRGEDVDHVGTRLHGGIRALQHKCRSIIIAVDNRAIEMGRDFNLPTIPREEIAVELEDRIKSSWKMEIRIDQSAIASWKKQFFDEGGQKESQVNEWVRVEDIARKVLPRGLRRAIRSAIDKMIYH